MYDESSDLTIWSAAFYLNVLAMFLVMLRLWRRGLPKSTIQSNPSLYNHGSDILMVIAYVLAIANSMVAWPEIRQGIDYIALSDSDIERLLLSKYLSDLLYTLANGATKLSIISFFIEKLDKLHPARPDVVNTWRRAAYWTIAFTLLLALQCQPLQKAWKADVEGMCISDTYIRIFQTSTGMSLDLYTVFIATMFMRSIQTDSLEASVILCSGLIVGALDAYIHLMLSTWMGRLVQGTSYEALIWPVIDLFMRIFYANTPFLYTVYLEYVTMKDSV